MQIAQKENQPVFYNAGATKILHFTFGEPSQCFSMHWHERLEILRVKSGILEYSLGAEKGSLQAGEVLVVPPKIAHFGKTTTGVSYDVLMFDLRHFYNETSVCKQLLTAIFDGHTEFNSRTGNRTIVDCVDDMCNTEQPDSLEMVSNVYRLLHVLIESNIITICKAPKDSIAQEMVAYMEQHYRQNLSVKALCDRFGYTSAHFCRKFKKATGLAPLTYLKIYRLEKALDQIKNSNDSIGEIADACGFADSNYFTRCFTSHYGHPPTHYRT